MSEHLVINPEIFREAEGLLAFAATHLLILAERRLLRPHIKNPTVSKAINLTEHVLSYTTAPMGYNAVEHLLHLPNNIGWDTGLVWNITRSFLVDYYIPARAWAAGRREEGAQWDQVIANNVGMAIYWGITH